MEQQQAIRTARLAGLWYLLLAISGMLGFLLFHGQIFVKDNPAQILNNLIQKESVASIRLVMELIIIVSQSLAAFYFYKLFVKRDATAALALLIWGTVNAVLITISAISMSVAIDLAHNSTIALQEKLPLIQVLSNIIGEVWSVGGLFFGLWLLPMGYIVIKHKTMPTWLGYTLLLGGLGYLLQTFLKSAGYQNSNLGLLVMPATIGELWMIVYLLVWGIRPVKSTA
ncbi:MAG: DUF4386 domain-containing protein [Chitinophagaceae bacterium]|nr:DUF4386 domain-containing protein [Chitinophagaceae bacterium]